MALDADIFETKLAALDRLIHAELILRDQALHLQHGEYGRRLDELNHAHAQAQETAMKFISSELYYSEHNSLRAIVEGTARQMIAIQGDLATMRTIVYGSVGLVLIGVAGSILALVIRK